MTNPTPAASSFIHSEFFLMFPTVSLKIQ